MALLVIRFERKSVESRLLHIWHNSNDTTITLLVLLMCNACINDIGGAAGKVLLRTGRDWNQRLVLRDN